MQDINSYYTALHQSQSSDYQQHHAKANSISIFRLAFFIAWICLLILIIQVHWALAVALFYLGAYCFNRLMRWHDTVRRQATIASRMASLCKEEQAVLALELDDRDAGQDLLPNRHAYAEDLDLFAKGGIFSLVSRCRTSLGRQALANALTIRPKQRLVDRRRGAANDLSNMPEWMLRLQAEGYDIEDSASDLRQVESWLQQDNQLVGISSLRHVIWWLPLLTIIAFSWLWYQYSFIISLIALLPNLFLLTKHKSYIGQLQQQVDQLGATMQGYSRMLAFVEDSHFEQDYLVELQERLKGKTASSKAIARLSLLVNNINLRNNVFGVVLNIFTLWDLHYGRKLEQWRTHHRQKVSNWFNALAELELLVSVGTLNYHHPDWCDPRWHEQAQLIGQSIGHPLLPPDQRVTNDFSTSTQHHVTLLTGSNMGGKSTFLRTVGLQLVMTYLGSKVCASSWSMPYGVELFTSMRTQDAIQESTSGFYAELRRLQHLIEKVEDGQAVFYLLDEVLKGTNSTDRNKGAAALIRQLVKYESAGIISTHDTTLHTLASELPGKVDNRCFEVSVEGDQLTFDYKLRDGVSKSFNATALMRQIGIDV